MFFLQCPEMSCGHCSGSIEKEIGKLAGVASVSADPKSKDVQVGNPSCPSISHPASFFGGSLMMSLASPLSSSPLAPSPHVGGPPVAPQIEFNDPCTWDEIKRTLVANEFPPEGEEIVS